MVNQVGTDHLTALQPGELGQARSVSAAGLAALQQKNPSLLDILDDASAAKASISDEALFKLQQEQEAKPYADQARRMGEQVDMDKVQQFRQLLDAGRLGDYWRNLSDSDLAGDLLSSPVASALK